MLNDPHITLIEVLQPLWSGYGEIARYYSPLLNTTVIAKSVKPPKQITHPRGWHSSTSHERKLTSYKVEAHFYQKFATQCTNTCYVPQIVEFSGDTDSAEQILVIQDLQELGFHSATKSLSIAEIKLVISWLAHFHAQFLGNTAEGLWATGTYWYLQTRLEEFTNMQPSLLKQAASFFDEKLNQAKYQTIVHGDAKLANFCFGAINNDSTAFEKNSPQDSIKLQSVAAVDFQYVGRGVGVKDLAYFLGSCLEEHDLFKYHDELLSHYFTTLVSNCRQYHPTIDSFKLETEWRELYPFANADFYRFLQGWSPGHQKINKYLLNQTDTALLSYKLD